MKVNPIVLSLASTALMLAGFILYLNDNGTLGIPILLIGLFASVASVVLRWSQSKR